MKLATLLASLAAVTTSAFSPISIIFSLPAPASNSQLFAMPICIVVEAEIKEDRMDEFLDMIEKNAVGSRAEPGCIRFGMYWWFLVCIVLCVFYWRCRIYYLEAEKAMKTARKHKKTLLHNMVMTLHGVSLSIYFTSDSNAHLHVPTFFPPQLMLYHVYINTPKQRNRRPPSRRPRKQILLLWGLRRCRGHRSS